MAVPPPGGGRHGCGSYDQPRRFCCSRPTFRYFDEPAIGPFSACCISSWSACSEAMSRT